MSNFNFEIKTKIIHLIKIKFFKLSYYSKGFDEIII